MNSLPPWTPPPGYAPEAIDDDPQDAPVQPPLFGPPPPPRRRSGPRGVVVAVVLVGLIVVMGLSALTFVGTRGDDDAIGSSRPASGDTSGRPRLEPPKVPEGFELFEDLDGSFAIVVPRGWETVLLDDASVRRARDRLEDENPPVAAALEQLDRLPAGQGVAFAAERADRDGFVASMNLLLLPRSNQSLPEVVAIARAELEAQGAKVSGLRGLEVENRAGLVLDIELTTPSGTFAEQQLYLASGFRVYVLTVAGTDPATAQDIVESLRVP